MAARVSTLQDIEILAVKYVIESLHDPYNPTHCSGSLVSALALCFPLMDKTSLGEEELHIRNHKLVSIAMESTKNYVDALLGVYNGSRKQAPVLFDIFIHQARAFFGVLGIMNKDHVLPKTRSALMDGCELKAVQLCSLIVALLPNVKQTLVTQDPAERPMVDKFITESIKFGWGIYRNFSMDKCKPPAPDLLVAKPIVDGDCEVFFGSHDGFEAELGLNTIWGNGVLYGCSAKVYDCNSYFEAVGRDPKVCEGCYGVYYCSKACQAKDWNDEQCPHKKICPALAKIVSVQRDIMAETHPKFERSNQILVATCQGIADLEKVEDVRYLLEDVDLTHAEKKLLKRWGRRIYKFHRMEKPQLKAGYDDYDAIRGRLTDPNGIYKIDPCECHIEWCFRCSNSLVLVARMNTTLSEEIMTQKTLLRASPDF